MNHPIQFAKPAHEKRLIFLFVMAVATVMTGLVTLLALGNDGNLEYIGGMLMAIGGVYLAHHSTRRKTRKD